MTHNQLLDAMKNSPSEITEGSVMGYKDGREVDNPEFYERLIDDIILDAREDAQRYHGKSDTVDLKSYMDQCKLQICRQYFDSHSDKFQDANKDKFYQTQFDATYNFINNNTYDPSSTKVSSFRSSYKTFWIIGCIAKFKHVLYYIIHDQSIYDANFNQMLLSQEISEH